MITGRYFTFIVCQLSICGNLIIIVENYSVLHIKSSVLHIWQVLCDVSLTIQTLFIALGVDFIISIFDFNMILKCDDIRIKWQELQDV